MVSFPQTNLAAILTPPGVGAIAVIRLHGPAVEKFLDSCFSRSAKPNHCVHGELRNDGNVIDDPVVVLAQDAQSADLNVHGGAWVIEATLRLAQRHGFQIVDASHSPLPDFTLDAETEIEQEILAYLPLATTQLAVRVLLAQSAAWERTNIHALSPQRVNKILSDRSLHWLLHPPRVAIVGIPNAGKSTLANQLFGQSRSITADLPGTTRDWIGETANLDGLAITLVDTPGIRDTNDAIEAQAIDRAREQINTADATVLVLDANRPHDPSQQALIKRFPNAIRVLNKIDAAPALNPVDSAIPTIATTGHGTAALRTAVRVRFQCDSIDLNSPKCWTPRQRRGLVASATTENP
jgi:tRNA modification GTPase